MKKTVPLLFLFSLISFVSLSQSDPQAQKECRISGGFGFAGATKDLKKPGTDFWLQLDYTFKDQFSLAFEFENFGYKQPGYFETLPVTYANEISVINNSFSLLVKYNVKTMTKLKLAFASGWTYTLRTSAYYLPSHGDLNSDNWYPYITTFDDYIIPFLTEVQYPIYKSLNLTARLKYNLNTQNGSTYSAGIGLSLKL